MMEEGDYISFQKASAMLTDRLTAPRATREEVALWAWFGKRHGGIDAYVSPKRYNGSAPPVLPSPTPDQVCDGDRPWTWLFSAYFLKQEIESFDPTKGMGRFISWGDLLIRWQAYGLDEDEVRAKVRERSSGEDVVALAPIFGAAGTETREEKEADPGGIYAPDAWAMFPLAAVEAIEAQELPHIRNSLPNADEGGTPGSVSDAGTRETATNNVHRIKRSALIAKYQREWPTIENDLRHSDENGLRKAAKLEDHGYWNESAAVQWGKERGNYQKRRGHQVPTWMP